MSKKKTEKEGKEKKQSGKKTLLKAKSAAGSAAESVPSKPKIKVKKASASPKKKEVQRTVISETDIGLRAYYIAERRQKMGWPGDSTSDWVEAERQLKAEAVRKKTVTLP